MRSSAAVRPSLLAATGAIALALIVAGGARADGPAVGWGSGAPPAISASALASGRLFVTPEDVKAVQGVLTLRFPKALDTVALEDLTVGRQAQLRDLTVTVVARGRKSVTLQTNRDGDRVYATIIPRNVRLGEAPSHGKPVILYDVKSRGAEAYLSLAREFIAREHALTTRG